MELLFEKVFSSVVSQYRYNYAIAAAFAALNNERIDRFDTKKTKRRGKKNENEFAN